MRHRTAIIAMSGLLVLVGLQSSTSVSITASGFAPSQVSVKTGAKVTFTNNDGRDHKIVFADGQGNSGNLSPGGSHARTFGKSGTYNYSCSYHPREKGVVRVSD